ncbi:MAG: hypothetical protein IJD92_04150 [Bacilli bacterium]|nr:hypothetical protein [Bacilli bacterium]
MNKRVSGIVGVILSVIILMYFENFSIEVLKLLGLNIYNLNSTLQLIINIIIRLLMCFMIYVIYKKDFKSKCLSNNILKSLLVFVVSLISLVIGMYLFDYVVNFIGDIFDITVLDRDFYNIFNKTLNMDLIVRIMNDYLIKPFLYVTTILLGIEKLTKRNDTFIMFSGLLASIVYAVSLEGTLGYVIINSLSMFMLFCILAFIFKKQNSVWFIILLYSFYLISSVLIINNLGW